ncbi:MAG: hypothetical protein R3Y23_02755 [Bacillota bacterium]
MFGKSNKSFTANNKLKKNVPMSVEAKKRQQSAIVGYYINKRKEEDKRNQK